MLREHWRVASRPLPFFQRLADEEPRLLRAGLAGAASVIIALLVAALAILRLSDSDAYLPILLGVPLLGLVNWLLIWGFGGLVVMRPAQLDLRGWELAAWSWAPAGLLGLSLLPAVFLAPLPSLILGYAATLTWHIALLNSGLRVFAPQRRLRSMLWYLLAVVVLPWAFFALMFALLPRG